MKKIISYSLIFCLLLQITACYTLQPIDNFNVSDLYNIEDKDIKITLVDGKEIYSKSFHHTFVTDTSQIILACGKLYKKSYKQSVDFKGKFYPDQIKSVTKNETSNVYNIFLNNEDIIRVKDVDYIVVTPETEKGLVIWKDGKKMNIHYQGISRIEVDEFNVTNTILLVSAGVLLIGLIVAASAFSFDGSWLGSGSF